MAFDEDKEKERVNVLCFTAQAICRTLLTAKFILTFEDIKAHCAFVASVCERTGCDASKSCLDASKATTGKEFNEACKKSLKNCKETVTKKRKDFMEQMGMKVPAVLQDPNDLPAGRSLYIR